MKVMGSVVDASGVAVSGAKVEVRGELHAQVRTSAGPGNHPTTMRHVDLSNPVTVQADANGHYSITFADPIFDPLNNGDRVVGTPTYRATARVVGAHGETLATGASPVAATTTFTITLHLHPVTPAFSSVTLNGTVQLAAGETRIIKQLQAIGAGPLHVTAMTMKLVGQPSDGPHGGSISIWDDDQPALFRAAPLAGAGTVLKGQGSGEVQVQASDGGPIHAWSFSITNPLRKPAHIDWSIRYTSTYPIVQKSVHITQLNTEISNLLHVGPGDNGEPPVRLVLGPRIGLIVRADWNDLLGTVSSYDTSPAKVNGTATARPIITLQSNGRSLDLVMALVFDQGTISGDIAHGFVANLEATKLGAELVIQFGVEQGLIVPVKVTGSTNISLDANSPLLDILFGPLLGEIAFDLLSSKLTDAVRGLVQIDLPTAISNNRIKFGKTFTKFFTGADVGQDHPVLNLEIDPVDPTLVIVTYIGTTDQPLPELPPVTADPNLQKIDHIVVLMMENRSFDHMLGYLSREGGRTDVDGLTASGQWNIIHSDVYLTHKLTSTFVPIDVDPCHSHVCTAAQIGANNDMNGFVQSFSQRIEGQAGARSKADDVIGYHGADHVWAYDMIAKNFAVCDRWFSSHPGPTWPNRYFLISCHLGPSPSGGPDVEMESDPSPISMHTIFDELTTRNIPWRYFEGDVGFLRKIEKYTFDFEHVVPIDDPVAGFWASWASADPVRRPAVTFIDPNFADFPDGVHVSNDDHPPTDIAQGQVLVAKIYNALRASPAWGKTLFVITYDEHGGFYDHVPPPAAAAPPGSLPTLGVRVPALVVSPFTPGGSVSHTVFDHTSVARTIFTRFSPDHMPDLGPRFDAASHLGELLGLPEAQSVMPQVAIPAVPTVSPSVKPVVDDPLRIAMRALKARVDPHRPPPGMIPPLGPLIVRDHS